MRFPAFLSAFLLWKRSRIRSSALGRSGWGVRLASLNLSELQEQWLQNRSRPTPTSQELPATIPNQISAFSSLLKGLAIATNGKTASAILIADALQTDIIESVCDRKREGLTT